MITKYVLFVHLIMYNLKEIQNVAKHDFSFLRQYWLSFIKLCFSKWYPFNLQKMLFKIPSSQKASKLNGL